MTVLQASSPTRRRCRYSLTLPVALTFAPMAVCQDLLHTFSGNSPGDELGHAVAGAGDVNGDGFEDIVVGAPRDKLGGKDSGTVLVYSGANGSVLHSWSGIVEDVFGFAVDGARDVDGDGFDDILVGAPEFKLVGNEGFAQIFSGSTGNLLYTFNGDAMGDKFGYAVAGAGDLNGDGFDDVVVGGWQSDTNGTDSGMARAFSGQDGSILFTWNGDATGDYFGIGVGGAGDVNGDGFADVIVGAPEFMGGFVGNGYARIFSELDGSQLHDFKGDAFGDLFGFSVSGADDVDGDGLADVIVGIPWDDPGPESSGAARVFSGLTGTELYTFDGDHFLGQFGWSVAGAGDVNGDGFSDLIVGAPIDDGNGTAQVFSGRDGTTLIKLVGISKDDNYGESVAGAGDVNHDGTADIVVGSYREDQNGDRSGAARVYRGFGGPIGTNYCGPANLNSTGQSAILSAFGVLVASEDFVILTASQLPPNAFGYFLNSDVQGFTPFPPGSQGNLCLGGGIGRHAKQVANTGAAGELILDLDLTALPRPNGTHSVVAGETWNFQCWFRDNQGGPTSNFTDGIEIVFQ